MNKASEKYWESVWSQKEYISKIDLDYYTSSLLHNLYNKFFEYDSDKEICEIGCAMSNNLLYFQDHFGYKISGFDYEEQSVLKTDHIYKNMNYSADIYHRDFFKKADFKKYDILSSFGVFEHFENLNECLLHTRNYLHDNGMILTVIPNMKGIVGFLQKILNKDVYKIHIPYNATEILNAHETAGYQTLFCDYFGIYQGGVINTDGIKNENFFKKLIAIPGKPLYYTHKITNLRFDSKYNSPYIIYIGKKS